MAATVGEVTPVAVEEAPVVEQPKEPEDIPSKGKSREEPEDDEHAKDGVSLDELFSMKPEIFQTPGAEDDRFGG